MATSARDRRLATVLTSWWENPGMEIARLGGFRRATRGVDETRDRFGRCPEPGFFPSYPMRYYPEKSFDEGAS
jgi:hypothetical protein